MEAMMDKDDTVLDVDKMNLEQGRGPEDADTSRGDSSDEAMGKRKHAEREPNSPGENHTNHEVALSPYAKKERTSFYGEMDNDSPASYPKHVIVPTSESRGQEKNSAYELYPRDEHPQPPADFSPDKMHHGASVLTPDSAGRRGGQPHSYEAVPQMQQRHQQYPDVYRAPSYQEMEYGRPYTSQPSSASGESYQPAPHNADAAGDQFVRPRRWACDYCNVATFLSYEEACAHEEACARRHHEQRYHDAAQHPSTSATYGPPQGMPPLPHHHQPHHPGGHHGTGLGVLYHASQEVVTPPTPHHRQQQNRWPPRGPPLPMLPHEQGQFRPGPYFDAREDPAYYGRQDPYYYPQPPAGYPPYPPEQYYQKRMLLAMPTDNESLSDRQCYVRNEMVEIFAATEKDVAARHSKGAQKLIIGQVGIRCVHCSHIRARDRAERAVCYPSSISRIYQTVADMQRFHFEQCREIPDHVRQIYKKLKTTRPRGVGSPQSYWVQSARSLCLVDTGAGIRFDSDTSTQQHQRHAQSSEMSISTL